VRRVPFFSGPERNAICRGNAAGVIGANTEGGRGGIGRIIKILGEGGTSFRAKGKNEEDQGGEKPNATLAAELKLSPTLGARGAQKSGKRLKKKVEMQRERARSQRGNSGNRIDSSTGKKSGEGRGQKERRNWDRQSAPPNNSPYNSSWWG